MRKVVLTIEGRVSDRAPLDLSCYEAQVTSLEDCFFDVHDAVITEMREADDDGSA